MKPRLGQCAFNFTMQQREDFSDRKLLNRETQNKNLLDVATGI